MKLYETLEKQLKKEPNYVTDNGELKKWVVINKAQNYDAELIGLLLDDKELKAKFFLDIKGVLIFNQSLFVQFFAIFIFYIASKIARTPTKNWYYPEQDS